jgi:predicted small secreted protein
MKTKGYFFGLPVMLLALGLVLAASLTLAGCGEEEEGGGGG